MGFIESEKVPFSLKSSHSLFAESQDFENNFAAQISPEIL